MTEIEEEEWRPTHHPDYEVSNLGRVRSRAPRGGDLWRGVFRVPAEPRILRPGRTAQGYYSVVIGGRAGRSELVHRLVAAAFIGPCPPGQEVRHKDDNRLNAHWLNLEYGTRAQNINDCITRGRFNRPIKIPDTVVKEVKARLAAGETASHLSRVYGVSRRWIQQVALGRYRVNV